MFHITIDSDSALSIQVIAHMADIELNEGCIYASSVDLSCFLDSIENGLDTMSNGCCYIVGKSGEGWEDVAIDMIRIAAKIRKAIKVGAEQREVTGG